MFMNQTVIGGNDVGSIGECRSPFPSRDDLSSSQRLSLIICFTLLTPMTIILNGFLIYGLYKTKQHRNVFSRFILALSVSDFCIGLFVQPVVVYLFIPGKSVSRDCTSSWYLTISAYVFLNFSGLVIFMVSIDRFLRLRKSHKYTQHVTLKKVNFAITGAFLFSLVTAFAAYLSAMKDLFCLFNMIIIIINFIFASGILNFYFLAWRNVRKRISNIRNLSTRSRCSSTVHLEVEQALEENREISQSEPPQKKTSLLSVLSKSKLSLASRKSRPSYDAAMTRTVAAILVCCCVTYPPYFIVSFYRSLTFTLQGHCNRKSHPTNIWFFWAFFLMFLNCVVNVVLYSCHNRQLKELLKTWKSFFRNKEKRESMRVTTFDATRDFSHNGISINVKEKPSYV